MKISGRWFDVSLKSPTPPRRGKLGIAASKKVIKLAVDRNKIKRQIRAITKELASGLMAHYNVKVIVKTAGRSFGDIKSDLAAVFRSARKRIIGPNREAWPPKEAKPLG